MSARGHLVLADGTKFAGSMVGASGSSVGEAVFTTGMTGYQEVLTDPSYCDQIVTMTAPQIGNTGTTREDDETTAPFVSGFVVREISPVTSNWRSERSLQEYLRANKIVCLSDVDTRALTRHIRDHGAQMAAIGDEDPDTLCDRARAAAPMTGRNLADKVSTKGVRAWDEASLPTWRLTAGAAENAQLHIVAVDLGIKHNILRCLVDLGCQVTLVPSSHTAEQILALNPDGIFLSNGPGDPAAVTGAIKTIQALLGRKPIFGICLGHQLLSLALGATSHKLKFGHRGLNQPVQDLQTSRVEVTTQNHGFVVDHTSLPKNVRLTHQHLNDGTCEGIEHPESAAFSVQYHPEAAAGPHDSRYLFDRFVATIKARS